MDDAALAKRLAEPFDPSEVEWKAQVVSKDGKRALAVAYVDARAVIARLIECFGVGGWQDDYELLPAPSRCVRCRLSVRVDRRESGRPDSQVSAEWVTFQDVGGPSDQSDPTDQMKSAFSDALKRAAVKLGIGAYLYRLPKQWVRYDRENRCLAEVPKLPDWAYPAGYPEQVRRLEGLLAQTGFPEGQLLQAYSVGALDRLPGWRFAEVETRVRLWAARKALREAEERLKKEVPSG